MAQAKPPLSEAQRELAAGYVLGDLDPDKRMQFETQLQANSALQAEVQALRVSLRVMPQGLQPLAPPPPLRDRILTAHARSIRSPRRRITWQIVMTGIAVLVALLSSFDNLRLRRDLSLAQGANPTTVALILQRPKSRLVTLRSQIANRPAGTVLFTPGQWQEIVVSLGNLPPLPPDRAYHLWLTLKDGRVLFCGKFQSNAEGRVFVTLRPPQGPPKGIKATGVFVTLDTDAAPVQPQGNKILSGEI